MKAFDALGRSNAAQVDPFDPHRQGHHPDEHQQTRWSFKCCVHDEYDALKHQKGLDQEIRDEMERQSSIEEVELEDLERVKPQTVLMIVGARCRSALRWRPVGFAAMIPW